MFLLKLAKTLGFPNSTEQARSIIYTKDRILFCFEDHISKYANAL